MVFVELIFIKLMKGYLPTVFPIHGSVTENLIVWMEVMKPVVVSLNTYTLLNQPLGSTY